MADSLSVRVDSPPPKFGVSFEQTMREAKYSDDVQRSTQEAEEPSPNSFQKVALNQKRCLLIMYKSSNMFNPKLVLIGPSRAGGYLCSHIVGCGAGLVSKAEQPNIVRVAIAAGLSLTWPYIQLVISPGPLQSCSIYSRCCCSQTPFNLFLSM
ncbi:uncharacterized protein LOC114716537 isoform X1 [Neltuma alba]|uniref:uncharacterized protein LOC114716537 isoform X1 n=1 Tax=Neltuma alba TaxID=207710 RepID=UPI0010A44109|nr:uncharacterized protein LOC114716537 isoform X1 [Prosopis alba]